MSGLPHRTGDREESRQGAGAGHLHVRALLELTSESADAVNKPTK